jgi:murein DD-endopeptidase MepM/ murein hydrolase activator NlpD
MNRITTAWLATALGASVSLAADAPVEVAPGTLVVWRGEGTESCGMEGRSFKPLEGACWFPVDLLHAEGALEVTRRRAGAVESRRVRVTAYAYPEERLTLPDDTHVNLSQENQERANREAVRLSELWSLGTPVRFGLPLAAPLDPLPEGGRFGQRRIFNGEPRSPHSGIDYPATTGTPVFAAAEGRVVMAEELFFSGNSVFVDHGDGLITMYFHLSRILVAAGETVERGQRVGLVGQTGRVTGPHLHFGVRWLGARVDPRLLLGAPSRVSAIP